PSKLSLIGSPRLHSHLWRSLVASSCHIGPHSLAFWPLLIVLAVMPSATFSRTTFCSTVSQPSNSAASWTARASLSSCLIWMEHDKPHANAPWPPPPTSHLLSGECKPFVRLAIPDASVAKWCVHARRCSKPIPKNGLAPSPTL